jgi:hypothetical protein
VVSGRVLLSVCIAQCALSEHYGSLVRHSYHCGCLSGIHSHRRSCRLAMLRNALTRAQAVRASGTRCSCNVLQSYESPFTFRSHSLSALQFKFMRHIRLSNWFVFERYKSTNVEWLKHMRIMWCQCLYVSPRKESEGTRWKR